MRLADFILSNTEPIVAAWEAFARGIAPGAKMDTLALRDNVLDILLATARDMGASQSPAEQSAKSRGVGLRGGEGGLNGASEIHAAGRLGSGFDIMEVVSEYRALRASVLQLWRDSSPAPDDRDVDDLTRFNESIDQSLGKAVSSYTRQIDQARDMFLAILGHDLRNPLNSIAMSAELLPRISRLDAESIGYTSQISTNAQVMARMISDLLDYTRTRLGAGMPVSPAPMNIENLCRELFNEFHSAHPDRLIRFQAQGDLSGEWDSDRLRQAFSNLLGNAIQHGAAGAPIAMVLTGEPSDVIIVISNGGPPIPSGILTKIFDPLVRGSADGKPLRNRPGSIGLGLYIAREIARAHGGTLDVASSTDIGTAFTLRLPRHVHLNPHAGIIDEVQIKNM